MDEALNTSANNCIPALKTGSLKFWWDQEMDELKLLSVNSFRVWQAAGKPKHGLIHDDMQGHRMRYRKAIKDKDKNVTLEVSNELHEALVKKDVTGFLKMWKSKFSSNKNKISIDGYLNNNVIADEFANFC